MQRYVSEELTHLTGRGRSEEGAHEALLSILRSGVLRHGGEASGHALPQDQPGAAFMWNPDADLVGHEMFKADIVCFCDIPVADLAIHARKYSRFGLAFRKRFLLEKGATPVFYVASDATSRERSLEGGPLSDYFDAEVQRFHRFSRMVRDANAPREGREQLTDEAADQDLFLLSMRVLRFFTTRVFSFVKFFEARLPPDHERNYYMEREWRVLGAVQFALDDVHRVLIPPEFGERLRDDLPAYRGQVNFLPE
jgi:Putative abortive phage resistance protein AbiGi, antitoxin